MELTAAAEKSKMSPTVNRILLSLRERIVSGAYAEGEWLPAERALADEFQVSRILVRAAVKALDDEGFLVCSARHRPVVRPLRTPTRLQGATSRTIAAWIWPPQNWPGSALTIRGIQEALGEEFRLMLGGVTGETMAEIRAAELRFLRQIHRHHDIEGILLNYMGGDRHLPLLEELRALGIPMVFLDHSPPEGFEADYVGVNNKRGAELAVKHLIELGHRRIAHISNFDAISSVTDRLAGYRRALNAAGIPFAPELVEKYSGIAEDDPKNSCDAILDRILRLPDPPTALFCIHDVCAFQFIAALRQRGIRIPEDISMVGFDGIERWMPVAPFLTTVYQPFDDIGSQAVDTLLERIHTPVKNAHRHTVLDARLHIHESTNVLAP